jgi:hypothetical protein
MNLVPIGISEDKITGHPVILTEIDVHGNFHQE